MSDYMASLHKLEARGEDVYLPGHGGAVNDARRFVQRYIRHREVRETAVLRRLAEGAADIPTLVRAIYIGLDPRLLGAAGLSLLAHLEDLVARGVVATDGPPSLLTCSTLFQLRFHDRCHDQHASERSIWISGVKIPSAWSNTNRPSSPAVSRSSTI